MSKGGNDRNFRERRLFLTGAVVTSGAVLAPALVGLSDAAAQHSGGSVGHAEAEGYVVDAATADYCATCTFWGGSRRVSTDGKGVTTTGLGWCNNPASPNYQKLTTPDHGPMTGVWRKWEALDRRP
jgi:hypothetical protein